MSGERRSAQAELVVVKGKHRGQFVKLGAAAVIIGRSSSVGLPLPEDGKVSGNHARVVPLDGERWMLEDMGSTNGTFLNDERVEQAPLKSGDLIRIGRSLIVFRADGSSVHLSDVRMVGGGSSADIRPKSGATLAPPYPVSPPAAGEAPAAGQPQPAGERSSSVASAVDVALQELVLASSELVFARRLERALEALLHGSGAKRALLFARHPLTGGLGAVSQRSRLDAPPPEPVLPELLRRACAGEVVSEGTHAAAPVRAQGLDMGALYLFGGSADLALLAASGLQVGLFLANERTRRLSEASCEVVGLLAHHPATRPVDVSALLTSLDRLFGPGARHRGLAWRVEVPPGLVGLADPILLGRGLDTLIEHAMAVARVELVARAAASANGERIHVQVVRDRSEPPEVTAGLLDQEGVAADLRRMGASLDDGTLAVARVALQRAGIGFSTRADGERAIYALELPGRPSFQRSMTSPGAVFLRIVQGPGRGQVLPIPQQQPITLGRSGQATFAFEDMQLSRVHCQVEARAGQCRIVDLRSRNGTFVNGQQVGAVLLRPGDRIQIGGIVFEVCDQDTPPPPPPPPPAAPPAACDGCKKPLEPKLGRALRGRWLCTRCFDRFDVEEDLIEGFQLLERVDVSSFGTTYLARQKLMERTVVVKTIQAGDGTDQVAVRRLLREAKTAGRLTHPHIVELYDVHETQGLLYVVIEHVEGVSLDRIMRERAGVPLPLPHALGVMSQIADALEHAHAHKIVHRDVKPANVVIRKSDGLAKLQGFTLAKHLEGQSVITADGESLGTPYFMPPEQVRSAKLADVRSDVYGWAATTYYCLSGKLPLEARSYSAFVDKVFNTVPPPLEEVLPGAPAPLSALLARCLERDPARRPQTIAEVRRELAPLLQEA